MAKSATLAIRIVSDASQAGQGFAEAESKTAGFQRGLDRASVAAGGVLAGVVAIGKEAYDAASEAQQSAGAIDAVFGAQAAGMHRLAQEAAKSRGLAASEYEQLASVIGSQLKNMGVATDELMPHTNALVARGADLAAQFGGSTSEAVSALSSLLRGERDPIERYGVSISQAGLDAQIASMGLDTSTEAAKKNAQYMATLALVSQQTASANGAFAREQNTAAGASQTAAAEFENAKVKLGDVLLPIVADAMGQFTSLSGVLSEHSGTVQVVAGVVAGLALAVLAVNAAMRVYAAGQAVASAAVFVFNAALWANPITWVVIAIAALVAAVYLAYQKFEGFRNIVKSVWEWLGKAWSAAGDFLGKVGGLFSASAPIAVAVQPTMAAGVYAAAGGSLYGAAPGVYGASPMTALSGGGSTAGQGAAIAPTVVNIDVTVQGAVDPMATGRQLVKILKDYGIATGGQVSLTIGGRTT